MKYIVALLLAVYSSALAATAKETADVEAAPWWTHAVIYEIYTRSFQDSNGDGIGDLKGISQRLGYLQKLGVDAIWLTPFFPSPNADFGYDISDYTDVAAEYGDLADWDALVKEAKRRNIRILVDLVLNHSSAQHPWFRESRSSRDNPKRDWYMWHDGKADGQPPTQWPSIFKGDTWTWDEATKQWYYHIFLAEQPDLNWSNPRVREAMYDVARFWLQRGASGFRLDATPYLFEDTNYPEDPHPTGGAPSWLKPYNSELPQGHEVMRELHAVLKSMPGEAILLGESATATLEGLRGLYGANRDEIHLPMDFMFANIEQLNATAFKKSVDEAQLLLGGQTPVFFLSSHDRSRQWNKYGNGKNNDQIAKLTAALLLLQRGSAIMYYGEELGMGDAPQSLLDASPLGPERPVADVRDKVRTPMQWNTSEGAAFTTGDAWLPIPPLAVSRTVLGQRRDANSIYRWYERLLKLRRENPVFRDGEYRALESGNSNVFAFARKTSNGHGALVLLNMSDSVQSVEVTGLPASVKWSGKPLMASPALEPSPVNAVNARLAPYGILVSAFR